MAGGNPTSGDRVKFIWTTSAGYASSVKNADTVYFLKDTNKIYVGEVPIADLTSTVTDSSLSSTSTNPLQNKAVYSELAKKVTAVSGKQLSTEDFTSSLLSKLNGIASGAEVNQNAFSNIKVGSTTVAADIKTDTLELVAGSNITLTPDATNDKVTVSATVPIKISDLTDDQIYDLGTVTLENSYQFTITSQQASDIISMWNRGLCAIKLTISDSSEGSKLNNQEFILPCQREFEFGSSTYKGFYGTGMVIDWLPSPGTAVVGISSDGSCLFEFFNDVSIGDIQSEIQNAPFIPTAGGDLTGNISTSGRSGHEIKIGDSGCYVQIGSYNQLHLGATDDIRADNLIRLPSNPTLASHAVRKDYVDNAVSTVSSEIPTSTSQLTNDSGFITLSDVPEGAAASTTTPKMDGTATVGTETSFARGDHIHPTDTSRASSTHVHGNITNTGDITSNVAIASGDRLVINDESASKVTNSSITFGTNNKQYLANNGTWQTVPTVPTKTSDLTNDSNFAVDASYVHTDNNFTTALKNKLDGVASGAEVNVNPDWNATSGDAQILNKPTTISGYGITDAYTKTQVDGLVSGVLHYKGTKATVSALPTSGNTVGDVWHVTADGSEHAWDGSAWQELGTATDLSAYYTSSQMDELLANKVTVESGKGLSSNDYTTTEKNKLSGISSGAQANVIETIKVNGTVQTVTSKAVDITVPTKTSQLTNNSNYVVDASYVHTDNNYTTTDKTKLSGIASGAEVNQNAFSNVKVGSTTVSADSKTDTLELVAGSNITLTPDATNDKVTVSADVPENISDLTNDQIYNLGNVTLDENNSFTITSQQLSDISDMWGRGPCGLKLSIILPYDEGTIDMTLYNQREFEESGSVYKCFYGPVIMDNRESDIIVEISDTGTCYLDVVRSYLESSVSALSTRLSNHTHGNITNSGDITSTAAIANGDRLVINDESANRITNSTITFGTNANQYLANNGTWQTISITDEFITDAEIEEITGISLSYANGQSF